MILYFYENDQTSGIIANGNSTGSFNKDLLWNISDDVLKPINGSFYVKVNAELYSKYIEKTTQKIYNYPGIYDLKCYFDTMPSYYKMKEQTVKDCKLN
jgi:hypothetical protein